MMCFSNSLKVFRRSKQIVQSETLKLTKSKTCTLTDARRAKKCGNWTSFRQGRCSKEAVAYVGLDAPAPAGRPGSYFLVTGSSPPFGVQYKARNYATVKFITKASQWRKIGTWRRRRKGRGAQYLRVILICSVSCVVLYVAYELSKPARLRQP
ncbi:hypothetical protein EVAR_37102_1 [Eumeta japonica]|uniref:Uncharacterized protein n=1 Tax=Eumeta variegata TaxID=151549 RepID=A0A4C1XRS0_EUMVA|nr:hypothetical protein EVAR_37102_1 [Eumeta japonica]